MIGGHRTTTAATVRKLKMHTAIFNFRLRNINSKVKGHNAHYLLLYKPGWGRTKRTANSLQSKPLWQAVECERSARIEEQLPACPNPGSWRTHPLKKTCSRLLLVSMHPNDSLAS